MSWVISRCHGFTAFGGFQCQGIRKMAKVTFKGPTTKQKPLCIPLNHGNYYKSFTVKGIQTVSPKKKLLHGNKARRRVLLNARSCKPPLAWTTYVVNTLQLRRLQSTAQSINFSPKLSNTCKTPTQHKRLKHYKPGVYKMKRWKGNTNQTTTHQSNPKHTKHIIKSTITAIANKLRTR